MNAHADSKPCAFRCQRYCSESGGKGGVKDLRGVCSRPSAESLVKAIRASRVERPGRQLGKCSRDLDSVQVIVEGALVHVEK